MDAQTNTFLATIPNWCNGLAFPLADFKPGTLRVLQSAIPVARQWFKANVKPNDEYPEDLGYWFGRRFNSDQDVIDRIRGASMGKFLGPDNRRPTDDEVMADVDRWVLSALKDCASADHWYMFEKDYGD